MPCMHRGELHKYKGVHEALHCIISVRASMHLLAFFYAHAATHLLSLFAVIPTCASLLV